MFKTKSTTAAVCLAATLLAGSAAGDDTDIYFVTSVGLAPTDVRNWPAIMISYDVREAAGAVTCSVDVTYDYVAASDPDATTPQDERYGFTSSDQGCQDLADEGVLNNLTVGGLPDPGDILTPNFPLSGHKIFRFELYAIVLSSAINQVLGAQPQAGQFVQVGLMMPHLNTTNTGNDCLPGSDVDRCSDGGMITLGFGPTQAEVNAIATTLNSGTALDCASITLNSTEEAFCVDAATQAFGDHYGEYIRQGKALANIMRAPGDGGSYNPDHEYASAEVYFELFRYLKGGPVFRGKAGKRDFDTNSTSNLYFKQVAKPKGWAYDPDLYANTLTSDPDPDVEIGWDWDILASGPDSSAWGGLDYTNKTVADTYISPTDQLLCSGVNVVNFVLSTSSYESAETGFFRDDDTFKNAYAASDACSGSDCGLNKSVVNPGGQNWVAHQVYEDLFGYDFMPDDSTSPGTQGVTSFVVVDTTVVDKVDRLALAGSGNTAGAFEASSVEDLKDALVDVLTRILSESATFLAPAVPASSVNRTQTLNEVFLALFQVKSDTFWPGNVKKLRIGEASNGELIVAGVPTGFRDDGVTPDFQPAFDLTGRIAPATVTYGTDTGSLSATFDSTESTVNSDGREVPRGGAGQRQPGFASRETHIYTEGDGGDAGDLVLLSTKENAAGYPDTALYDWMIGDRSGWVMGDMLHSRPVAINYGARGTGAGAYSATNPDIRIVVGSNDGFLRVIRSTMPGDHTETQLAFNTLAVQSMEERWAFVPKELFNNVRRLRNDSSESDDAPPPNHPNGFDGPITLIRNDNNGDDKITPLADDNSASGDFVWAIAGLRRGGRFMYALDMTDPDSPSLMWKIGNDGSSSVSELNFTGASNPADAFAEIGQTWSDPVVGVMEVKASSLPSGHCATATCIEPVIVFGGGWNGYPENAAGGDCSLMGDGSFNDIDNDTVQDPGEAFFTHDDDAPNRGCLANSLDDSKGNAVYIVHAESGQLIWKLIDKPTATAVTTATGGGWNGQGHVGAVDNVLLHPDLDDSVPATVSAVDMDGNGLLDRIYFGDTGGVLWRVNLADSRDSDTNCAPDPSAVGCPGDPGDVNVYDDTDPEHWRAFRLLSIGRNCSVGGCIDRRFLSQADVVSSFDDIDQDGTNSPFDGVIIGTGDRENPLDTSNSDVLYFYKDAFVDNRSRPILRTDPASTTALPAGDGDLDTVTFSETAGLITRSASFTSNLENGWRVPMPTAHPGEKVVGRPLTVGGVTFFTTFEPKGSDVNPCIPSAGTGRLWALNVADASAALDLSDPGNGSLDPYATLDTPGIPPPVIALGTGRATQDIYATGRKNPIVNTGFSIRAPTYWRREEN